MARNSGVVLSDRYRRQKLSSVHRVGSGVPDRQRGIALAIVVWFIAGMSLLVVGIVSHARVDIRMAQLHVARAQAVAAGDGAIQLMLAEHLLTQGFSSAGPGPLQAEYNLGNTGVSVTLYPAAGFINLDSAPQQVLAGLFLIVGQLAPGEANYLADNVVKWRGGQSASDEGRAWKRTFHSTEDLLRVEGMTRTLFDAIRDYVVVNQWSSSATDWALAPEVLLQVLEETNPGEIDAIRARRAQLADSAAPASGSGRPVQTLSGAYRADAVVSHGDQTWLRRRWVAVGSAPGSNLPWQFRRTEPPRVQDKQDGIR